MNLEPQVIRKIRSERRKAFFQRMLIRVPLLAAIVACIALIVLKLTGIIAIGEKGFTTINLVFLGALGALFLVLLVLFALFVRRIVRDNRRIVGKITGTREYGDDLPGRIFKDSLTAVAIGAGVEPPGLLVVDIPTVNALPISRDHRTYIGVTGEAIEANLPYREAEAMMSHTLSKAMLGLAWNAPVFLSSGLVPFFLLGFLAVVAVATLIIMMPGKGNFIGILVIGVYVILIALRPLGRLVFRRSDRARCHWSALADSIAVKITGDPVTLKTLIERLADGMREVEITRDLIVVSRYLFVSPQGVSSEILERFEKELEETFEGELDPNEYCPPDSIKKMIEYGKTNVAMRRKNLRQIERGNWQAFD